MLKIYARYFIRRAIVFSVCLLSSIGNLQAIDYNEGDTVSESNTRNTFDFQWVVMLCNQPGIGGLFIWQGGGQPFVNLTRIGGVEPDYTGFKVHNSRPNTGHALEITSHTVSWFNYLKGTDYAFTYGNSMTEWATLAHSKNGNTLVPQSCQVGVSGTYYLFPMKIGACQNSYAGSTLTCWHMVDGSDITPNSTVYVRFYYVPTTVTNMPGGLYNDISNFTISGFNATPKIKPKNNYPPILNDPDNPDQLLSRRLFMEGKSISWQKDGAGNWVGTVVKAQTSSSVAPSYLPDSQGHWVSTYSSVNPATGQPYAIYSKVQTVNTDGVLTTKYWVWDTPAESITAPAVQTVTTSPIDMSPDILTALNTINTSILQTGGGSTLITNNLTLNLTNTLILTNNVNVSVSVTVTNKETDISLDSITSLMVDQTEQKIKDLAGPVDLGYLDRGIEIAELPEVADAPTVGRESLMWDVEFPVEGLPMRAKLDLADFPDLIWFRALCLWGLRVGYALYVYTLVFKAVVGGGSV